MLRTVNRVLLALTGLAAVGLGGAVLLAGLDLPGRRGAATSAWWPFTGPDDVLLTAGDRTRFRDEGWWWPVVFTALGLAFLLLLWWFLAQLRRRRLGEVLVDSGDVAGVLLRGRALEEVLAAETEHLPGVDRAHVRLTGRRTAPRALAEVVLEPESAPAQVLWRFTGESLDQARVSAGLSRFPAELRLRAARHHSQRVV